MNKNYMRVIGFIMCLPLIYALYFCTVTQPTILILPCIAGGSTLAPFVVAAFIIGLYLLITGGGKTIIKSPHQTKSE